MGLDRSPETTPISQMGALRPSGTGLEGLSPLAGTRGSEVRSPQAPLLEGPHLPEALLQGLGLPVLQQLLQHFVHPAHAVVQLGPGTPRTHVFHPRLGPGPPLQEAFWMAPWVHRYTPLGLTSRSTGTPGTCEAPSSSARGSPGEPPAGPQDSQHTRSPGRGRRHPASGSPRGRRPGPAACNRGGGGQGVEAEPWWAGPCPGSWRGGDSQPGPESGPRKGGWIGDTDGSTSNAPGERRG